ncbi:MAG: oxidoreductase, partial [Gammaproteobacteria bacterium]|nr:oxidoreductase [Gammaproteobacteria bacterium]
YLAEALPGFTRLATTVHQHGCRLIGQLFHPGAEVAAFLEDGSRPVPVAPSAHQQERYLVTTRPMSAKLIGAVVAGYADTAARMIAAGFDGVEVLASHGYLPIQFIDPHINRRTDAYGGSFANRLRFLNEIHDAVRARVGADKLVGLRISADDKIPNGLIENDVHAVIQALDAADRFDYFNVTLGSSSTTQGAVHIVPPMAVAPGYVRPYARRLRQLTSRAVFMVGRINQPAEAEAALNAGEADMIGMTRAQICDPELGNKIAAERAESIRVCIGCNQACIGHYALGAPISCIQFPESGREIEFGRRVAAARSRVVMVIGGGPGGMKVAAVAAARGHRVTLYEGAARLGGQTLLAQMLPDRAEFGGIVTNLQREIEEAGVIVRTGVTMSAAQIRAARPDVVVIATGAAVFMPAVEVSSGAHIVDAWQVIKDEVKCGARVVIADWRGDWVGLGLATKLVRAGHHVRLAMVANAAGVNVQYYVRDPWIGELSRLGVEFTPYARLYGADESTVYFQHASTGHSIEFADTDTLVVSYGHRSVMDLYTELEDWDGEVHCIGDALAPRTAEEAVLDGLKIGSRI